MSTHPSNTLQTKRKVMLMFFKLKFSYLDYGAILKTTEIEQTLPKRRSQVEMAKGRQLCANMETEGHRDNLFIFIKSFNPIFSIDYNPK